MRHVVKIPKLGEGVDSVVILEWLKAVGDLVEVDAPLVLLETDKTTVELPAPVMGRLATHLVAPSDEVLIGAPICEIET